MDSNVKRNVIVAVSIGAAIIAGLFIKNKIQQSKFQPLTRDMVIQILKKSRKESFALLKKLVVISTNMSSQMKVSPIDPQMVKSYLDSPESPFKISQQFDKTYEDVCESLNIKYSHFAESVEFYKNKQDKEILALIEQSEKDLESSLMGKLPEVKVVVPENLNKQRLIQIHKKIILKRYLVQIEVFRKVRGKTQQDLASDPQLMKSLSNPESEEQKVLEEQGLGENDQPAAAVYTAAVAKFKADPEFRQAIAKIETHYAKIFNKYKTKLQNNKITTEELNELEEEFIYNPPI